MRIPFGWPISWLNRGRGAPVSSQKVGANPCGRPAGQALVHQQVLHPPLPQVIEKIRAPYAACPGRRLTTHHLATVVIYLVSMLALSLAAAPARAQELAVVENSSTAEYPEHGFIFRLKAVGPRDITAATLYYQRVQDANPVAVTLDFVADRQVAIEHTLVTYHQYLVVPFTEITYWWQIEDTAGQQVTTGRRHILARDDRFDWQELAGEGITVHWYRGGDPFGQALLRVSQATLDRLSEGLGIQLRQPIEMYVYATLTETGDFGRVGGEEWLSEERTVAPNLAFAVIPPRERGYAMMQSITAHQVTRLALTQTIPDAPRWLVEGLAVQYEERPAPDYFQALTQALRGRRIIPLEQLCHPWDPAALRYGESASVVLFIHDEYGSEAIADLLAAYRDGASCQEGVQTVLGISLEQLQRQWEASLQGELDFWTKLQIAFRYNPLVVTAIGFVIAIALVLAINYVTRIGARSQH